MQLFLLVEDGVELTRLVLSVVALGGAVALLTLTQTEELARSELSVRAGKAETRQGHQPQTPLAVVVEEPKMLGLTVRRWGVSAQEVQAVLASPRQSAAHLSHAAEAVEALEQQQEGLEEQAVVELAAL
jgi:hypothetical protein